MSLSQANSPEEAKCELKQQVFLAIQGKYDTRQTSQLVEDMNKIADDIADSTTDEAKSWQDMLSGFGLDTTSHIMECPTSISRQDASTINKLIDKGALKAITPQSDSEALDKAAEISKAIMDQPYNAILTNDKSEAKERPATGTRNVDFLFLGSDDEDHIDGTIESVPVCSNGTPINSRVKKPIPTERGMGMTDYYLREISIDAEARYAKVYFYATSAYLDNWSEQKLLDTIKRISLFHSR